LDEWICQHSAFTTKSSFRLEGAASAALYSRLDTEALTLGSSCGQQKMRTTCAVLMANY